MVRLRGGRVVAVASSTAALDLDELEQENTEESEDEAGDDENAVGALGALLLDDLEEDDVDECAGGEALKHGDDRRLRGEVIGRFGEPESDAGADRRDEGESRDVDGGEEGAHARADELGAHAEGDDVLVGRDGEEEEPD